MMFYKAFFLMVYAAFVLHAQVATGMPENVLKEVDHVNSKSLTNTDISLLVEQIASSNGKKPSFKELMNASKNADAEFIKDGYFVLALFGSGIANTPEVGVEALSSYQVYKEKSYGLNDVKDPSKLLAKAYSWLVINTSFIVPKALVKTHPTLVHQETPFWGSSLDGAFRIEIPNHWLNFFEDTDYHKWRSLLDDIETPSKKVWHGTMRNSKFKRERLADGLLTNNFDYFFNNFQNIKPAKWIEYWSIQGAFQYQTYQAYVNVKNISIDKLVDYLIDVEKVSKTQSVDLSRNYINYIENNYVYHDRYVLEYNALIQTLASDGWQAIVKDQELLDRWDNSGKLKTVGGHLLLNNTDNFVPYLEWLYSKKYFAIVSELLGLSMVIDGDHYKLINLMRVKPTHWGGFNKTPMMYAAHYDKYDALKFLFENFPSMTTEETIAGEEYDHEMPKIGGRTVLTYALENASYKTIEMVIKNTPSFIHKNKDSAGHDAMYYLSLNTEISLYEREKINFLLIGDID